MTAAVGIPWHDAGDDHRARSLHYVIRHIRTSDLPVSCGGPQPWTRAAARNSLAATLAADVVIINDADMVAPTAAYQDMAALAQQTGRLVIGYRQYRALDQASTEAVLQGADPFDMPAVGTTEGWSVGGILAITPQAWAEIGGMDERFQGWGCEDFAFAHAAALTLGPNLRVDTPAVHLWHATDQHPGPQLEANSALMARYTACRNVTELRHVQGGAA